MNLAEAFARAEEAAAAVRGTTSPNPPVGAVVLDSEGACVGVGATQPVGGDHAEVVALREAGERARGGTVVVTLEPCNHTGRTGPCTQALVEAQVARVCFAHPDPNPVASGGAAALERAGVSVTQLDEASTTLAPWLGSVALGRPFVTVKTAHTLDGFTAAPDGSSKWITGEQARAHVHRDRLHRDAILVGTGTVLTDDPRLTARVPGADPEHHQPRRVVIGHRAVPDHANLRRLGFQQFDSIPEALDRLWAEGARDLLVEGGAGLATSFFRAGLVDAVQAYVAPAFLGAGRGVFAGALGESISDIQRYTLDRVTRLGQDVLLELVANR